MSEIHLNFSSSNTEIMTEKKDKNPPIDVHKNETDLIGHVLHLRAPSDGAAERFYLKTKDGKNEYRLKYSNSGGGTIVVRPLSNSGKQLNYTGSFVTSEETDVSPAVAVKVHEFTLANDESKVCWVNVDPWTEPEGGN